jgi:uncharacterized membrane protein
VSTRARILLAAATALVTLAAPSSALAESSDVTSADVQLRLGNDASLLVAETLTFDYEGSFEASYRDILLRHGERVTDVAVFEGDRRYEPGGCTSFGCYDRDGTFGVENQGNAIRVVWHHGAQDEERTFTVAYRVVDGAVAYDDVIDVGWAVWGDQWGFDLDELRSSLADPRLDPDDPLYRVWGHPRSVEGETVRGDGAATLEASDVPDGTAVEMRVTVPRTPGTNVSGARIVEGEGLPKILAEEQQLDDDYNAPWPTFKRWVADNSLLVSLGLAALVIALLSLLSWLAREHPTDAPEHTPEPPDDANPALAYGLAHEGGDSDDTVLATLLDLVDRGYYTASSASTGEEELDLAIAVSDQRPPTEGLEPHEREVLGFFDELIGSETVAMSDMRDRIPKHSAEWRGRWEGMTEALNSAEREHLSWDRDFTGLRSILVVMVLLLFAAIALICLSEDAGWILPVVIGGATALAVILWPANRLRRMTPEHGARSARWQSFARWTEDFPRLEDDPPATLALWKRILVFGVAFGTAERMIDSGRIPEPVTQAAAGETHWTGYAFAGAISHSAFDGSSFSSGFASQVAPPASSGSGGGGGFSGGGGGGGFSGGGGGGSW